MFLRCVTTVCVEICNLSDISLLINPFTNSFNTSNSRDESDCPEPGALVMVVLLMRLLSFLRILLQVSVISISSSNRLITSSSKSVYMIAPSFNVLTSGG